MKKLRNWFFHPFLFGLFFVLALIASNVREVAPILTVRPLLFGLVAPGLLVLVLRLFIHDWRKAALVATGLIFLFFTYGRVYALLGNPAGLRLRLIHHLILASIWLLLGIAWIYLVTRRLDTTTWTRTLNIFGLALIAVPAIQILSFVLGRQVRDTATTSTIQAPSLHLEIAPGQNPPDIYYIILDMYTRQDALEQAMKYDNSPFIDALRKEGFYVADCSLSNYVYTTKSLTSSLNMAHLDELNPAFAPPNDDVTALYPYLQHNRVRRALEAAGYSFVAFETSYAPLNFTDADFYYAFSSNPLRAIVGTGLNPFESVLMQTSAATLLFDLAGIYPPLRPFTDAPYTEYRGRMLYAMDKIHEAVHIPGPKFVFLHLMAPHNPFVFGPNGERVPRRTPFTQTGDTEYRSQKEYIKGYTDELTYLNERIEEITSYILANSPNPPVIIVQGDHGVARPGEGLFVAWHNANLNALYLPGRARKDLYPNITPVNSFRVVFDQFFNAGLPLEKDTACYSSGNSFACQVVKDPNPACTALDKP
jgi:hypothetical protein